MLAITCTVKLDTVLVSLILLSFSFDLETFHLVTLQQRRGTSLCTEWA